MVEAAKAARANEGRALREFEYGGEFPRTKIGAHLDGNSAEAFDGEESAGGIYPVGKLDGDNIPARDPVGLQNCGHGVHAVS